MEQILFPLREVSILKGDEIDENHCSSQSSEVDMVLLLKLLDLLGEQN